MIPPEKELIEKLLQEFHSSPIGGHAGITRTMARLKAQFYWPKMQEDVKAFVQRCVICQQAKTSQTSSFKALYGRDPPTLAKPAHSTEDSPDVTTQLAERDDLLAKLKANLLRAQQVMKNQADKKRLDVAFQVGDDVLVKLQPYRQHSAALRKNQKLSMKYFGPFKILAKIGTVAYKLELPMTAKIHPVFHISQLKLFKGEINEPYMPLPLTVLRWDQLCSQSGS
jgi:HPt (histidine-containing phosphotransfer) domain-containing protein